MAFSPALAAPSTSDSRCPWVETSRKTESRISSLRTSVLCRLDSAETQNSALCNAASKAEASIWPWSSARRQGSAESSSAQEGQHQRTVVRAQLELAIANSDFQLRSGFCFHGLVKLLSRDQHIDLVSDGRLGEGHGNVQLLSRSVAVNSKWSLTTRHRKFSRTGSVPFFGTTKQSRSSADLS